MVHSTYFGLLAEFGCAEILLTDCCEKYFSLCAANAKRRAALYQLPVKAYRATRSQKGKWLVSAADLATFLDEQKAEAERLFQQMNGRR